MKVEFDSVAAAGDLPTERVILRVVADSDIGLYIVIQGENSNGETVNSSDQLKVFWFPDQKVKAGDYVVLYSRRGETSTKDRKDGKKTYFYYWDQTAPLWVSGRTPVVVEINAWKLGTRFP